MKLISALKPKKRYIVFQIISSQKFSLAEIKEAVEVALLAFLGQLGVSKASPLFVKGKNNNFIIKVNHTYVEECKSALMLIKKIKNKPVIVKSVITSGTIKKASLDEVFSNESK